MNGDSIPDVIVGAPIFIPYKKLGSQGYVEVISGDSGTSIATLFGRSVKAKIIGKKGINSLSEIPDRFGISVSSAGDSNKDGFADIVVGATFNKWWPPADIGYASVFSGNPNVLSYKTAT